MAASLECATYSVRAFSASLSRMDSAASTPPALASTHPSPASAFVSAGLFDDEALSGLWVSDGTEDGTLRLGSSPFAGDVVVASNRAFFTDWTPETGAELWVTDGTVAGTHVIDARPGPDGLFPSATGPGVALGNNVIFSPGDADQPGAILEPWISDGTVEGTRLLKDIEPAFGSNPRQLVTVGSVVFFTAYDLAHGEELWVTDGTPEGTRLVRDMNRGVASASPRWLRNIRGALYMSADDGVHGFEPWKVTP
jgi:ELWxxDGT repeat protein